MKWRCLALGLCLVWDLNQYAHKMLERTCRAEERDADDDGHLRESRKRQAVEQQEPAVDAVNSMQVEGNQAGAQDGAGATDQPPATAQQKACIRAFGKGVLERSKSG